LTPTSVDDDKELALYTKTTGGSAAVDHAKKIAELTSGDARARNDAHYRM
jgi:hypothetical protein